MTRPKLTIARAPKRDMARVKQAVRLFRNDLAPREVRRHNARQWLRAVEFLGPKWKLAEPMRLERSGT